MRRVLSVFLSIVALTGCRHPLAPPHDPPSAERVKIGVILPMSGPLASYGKGCREGIDLWSMGQSGIDLVWEDDQGDPKKSVEAFQRLEERGVKAIVGPVTSTCALALAPLADKAGLPMITPSASHYDVTHGHPFVFRTCFIDPMQGAAIATFAREHIEIDRVAVLTQKGEPYCESLAEAFEKAFQALGGTVVLVAEYDAGAKDFSQTLKTAKEDGAQAIFIPGFVHEVACLMRQAREKTASLRLLGGDGWDSPELFVEAGAAAEGHFYTSQFSAGDRDDTVRAFVQTFRGKYGREPGMLAALGYDAMLRIEGACGATPVTRQSICQALAMVPSFRGVTGPMTFDADHNPIKPVVILRTLSDRAVFEKRVTYGMR